jgi:hypothetical protein
MKVTYKKDNLRQKLESIKQIPELGLNKEEMEIKEIEELINDRDGRITLYRDPPKGDVDIRGVVEDLIAHIKEQMRKRLELEELIKLAETTRDDALGYAKMYKDKVKELEQNLDREITYKDALEQAEAEVKELEEVEQERERLSKLLIAERVRVVELKEGIEELWIYLGSPKEDSIFLIEARKMCRKLVEKK